MQLQIFKFRIHSGCPKILTFSLTPCRPSSNNTVSRNSSNPISNNSNCHNTFQQLIATYKTSDNVTLSGAVCRMGFSNTTAQAVCRDLGYVGLSNVWSSTVTSHPGDEGTGDKGAGDVESGDEGSGEPGVVNTKEVVIFRNLRCVGNITIECQVDDVDIDNSSFDCSDSVVYLTCKPQRNLGTIEYNPVTQQPNPSCEAGHYWNGARCMKCHRNTFGDGISRHCRRCENNTHSPPGSLHCSPCLQGEFYSRESKSCTGCPAGYTSDGVVCSNCGDGYHEEGGRCHRDKKYVTERSIHVGLFVLSAVLLVAVLLACIILCYYNKISNNRMWCRKVAETVHYKHLKEGDEQPEPQQPEPQQPEPQQPEPQQPEPQQPEPEQPELEQPTSSEYWFPIGVI